MANDQELTESPVWLKLLEHAAINADERNGPQLKWIKERVHHYSIQLGIPEVEILTRYDSTTPYYAEIQVAMTKSAKAAANSQGTNE